MKSPTADVHEAVPNLDEQNQHKIFKKRTREVVTEAANTGSVMSQKRKKLEENGFKQESDDTQRDAPTQEEKTEDPGIGWCQFCSFMQQVKKNFSQHNEGIQALKQQLQKDTKKNRETLDEMHKDLSETKKAVKQIEQKHMQPNDQLMEMMRQMSQEIRNVANVTREYHEREPRWFTDKFH